MAEHLNEETELLTEIARDIADLARQEKRLYDQIKALSAAEKEPRDRDEVLSPTAKVVCVLKFLDLIKTTLRHVKIVFLHIDENC